MLEQTASNILMFYFTDALETGNHYLGGKEKGWPWLLKAKKKQFSNIN